MHNPTLLSIFLTLLNFSHTNAEPQLAQGGGLAPAIPAPSQYPVVSNVPSLITVGGVTTVTQVVFTQTFASTALGGWDIGPTPKAGTIGLGDIQGEVGKVKSKRDEEKRALPTPPPAPQWGFIGKEVNVEG